MIVCKKGHVNPRILIVDKMERSMARTIDEKRKTILVTGATGHQGGAVIHSLLAAGWKVKALVRDPKEPAARAIYRKGADLVVGDLFDRYSLDRASNDVYGVFSVQAWEGHDVEDEILQGKNLADAAAKNANVKHFIYSSALGATLKTGVPFLNSKAAIEKHIGTNGLPSTIFRPVYFMFNFSSPEMHAAIMKGTMTIAIKPDKLLQMLAVEDLGEFVRMAFEHPGEYIGRSMDLAGDELTMSQVATAFSRTIGKTVRYAYQPIEDVPRFNPDMAKMFKWLNEQRYHVDIAALIPLHPGLMSFETWLHKSKWAKSA
jgi:uncharacterized protein YbjT (DUF2867 family)